MEQPVSWYSIDPALSLVERGPASKEDAMRILDDYFHRLKPQYETFEEAYAETTLGFQKSPAECIEIGIISCSVILFRYEVSLPRSIWFLSIPKILEKQMTLQSEGDLREHVHAFYDLNSTEFRRRLGV